MAKQPHDANGDDSDEVSTAGHNAKARAQIIREACREIFELDKQRQLVSEQIRAVKNKKIKGDLGMKLSDFAAALRLYNLEDEDRDEFFDTLRETFDALGVGEQLDWINALNRDNIPANKNSPAA